MYQYDHYDRTLLAERVAQYRSQVSRYLAGTLSEEAFLPLRLQNGVYNQRYSHMLRVAIPYGMLSAAQMRALAEVSERWDKGWGHFTTRQNVQFNWVRLEDTPDILAFLAEHDMHAIQTSGNCIRNIVIDVLAGAAADEIIDPRPLAEIVRQWAALHPEFAYLPRKFKIAMSGATADRALLYANDIGLRLYRNTEGQLLLQVIAGGGLGRTPIIGSVIHEGLPWRHLLTYLEAVVRVFNRHGRRDNKYKARIKILLQALGLERFKHEVEHEWVTLKDGPATLTSAEYQRIAAHFAQVHDDLPNEDLSALTTNQPDFARWLKRNVRAHKASGYANVVLSTKPGPSAAPGDLTSSQMRAVADWAERYGSGEIRIAYDENIVLTHIRQRDLFALWQAATPSGLATANIGLLTDIISCPGVEFCALGNARSTPIVHAIQARFSDLDYLHDLGDLSLKINGCMNACAHHHLGNIGILGVDKNGEEWYQIMLGGREGDDTALGKVMGPAFRAERIPEVLEQIIGVFLQHRLGDETFSATFRRIGMSPFKSTIYPPQ